MSAYKSDFLQVLAERGFIHQVSDAEGLDAKADASPITAYVGFDATAPSLHIGNLLTIMMLRWLQKTGHRPIALMGGGTSKIGDPSGKDASRTLLTGAQIDANIASIRTRVLALSRFRGRRHHGGQCRVGSTSCTIFRSCATSAAISPSTRC